MGTVTNADGAVTIESNGVMGTVIATDVLASNGVVHVIDTVLAAAPASEPATKEAELPSIAAAAIATPSLSTLVTAVGLVETLSGEEHSPSSLQPMMHSLKFQQKL